MILRIVVLVLGGALAILVGYYLARNATPCTTHIGPWGCEPLE